MIISSTRDGTDHEQAIPTTCGLPVIGIAQSGSDISPCNRIHLELAKRVRDGIRDAGGIPMAFPLQLGEQRTVTFDIKSANLLVG